MLSTIVGLLGFSLTALAFAYELWTPHRMMAISLIACAVIAALAATAVFFSPRIKAVIETRSASSPRWNWSGPVNLPTVLWSLNAFLIAGFLQSLFVSDRIKTTLNQSEDRMFSISNQTKKLLDQGTKLLNESKRIDQRIAKLESKLPMNFSAADRALLTKELRTSVHYHFRIYRELDEHMIRLANQLSEILGKAGWIEIAVPITPPEQLRLAPGLHVLASPRESEYLGAAYLVTEIWRVGIQTELQQNYAIKDCDCVMVTLAESR